MAVLLATSPAIASEAPSLRIEASTGIDAWNDGASVWLSALYALRGLDASGPVFKATTFGSRYDFATSLAPNGIGAGTAMGATLSTGWRGTMGPVHLTALIGADVIDRRLTPDDATQGGRGLRGGARGSLDLWWQPASTWMVAGSAQMTTIEAGYWTRLRAGWRFADKVWIGPEALAMGDRASTKARFGAHVSGFRWARTEWSLAGGGARSDESTGWYTTLSVNLRY